VSHVEISLDKYYVIGLFSQNFNKRNFFKKIMTREEFENQRDTYFQKMQWELTARNATRFVWALEVYGEIKPYLDFLDFFVELEWEEIDDKK
jgi:hypothetical protein